MTLPMAEEGVFPTVGITEEEKKGAGTHGIYEADFTSRTSPVGLHYMIPVCLFPSCCTFLSISL